MFSRIKWTRKNIQRRPLFKFIEKIQKSTERKQLSLEYSYDFSPRLILYNIVTRGIL